MFRLVCVVLGYLFGSVLTADIVVRIKDGKSVFKIGSGNPGMANVMAQCGFTTGLIVLAGDLGKTVIPILITRLILFPEHAMLAAAWTGLGCIVGHNWPLYHRFQGGKGVACSCAAIVLIEPVCGFISLIAGMIVTFISCSLPLGAIVIPAVFAVFCAIWSGRECAVIAVIYAVIMLIRHFPGLRGFMRGTEPKVDVLSLVKKLIKRI